MSPVRAVVFDFDLTLADSLRGFIDAYEFATVALGLPPPESEAYLRMIGTPLPRAVPRLFPDHEVDVEAYIRHWQARADATMNDLTQILPGAAAAVATLADAGLSLAIVSQKLRYRIEAVLAREGLLDSFTTIVGGEDMPDFKPDPRGLLLAIERLGVAPPEAVYVGDTLIDAETARRAGVAFVAVLTGVTPPEELAVHAPAAVLGSVGELPAHLGLP